MQNFTQFLRRSRATLVQDFAAATALSLTFYTALTLPGAF